MYLRWHEVSRGGAREIRHSGHQSHESFEAFACDLGLWGHSSTTLKGALGDNGIRRVHESPRIRAGSGVG